MAEGLFLIKGLVDVLASKNGRVAAEVGCALATAYPAYLAAKMALRPQLASPNERTRLLKFFALSGALAAAEPGLRRLPLSAHARLFLLLWLQLGGSAGLFGSGGSTGATATTPGGQQNHQKPPEPHNAAAAALFDRRVAPLLERYSRKVDVVLDAAWRAVAGPVAAAGAAVAEAVHEARQLLTWFFDEAAPASPPRPRFLGGGGGGDGGAAAARKRARRAAGAASSDEDEGVMVSRGSPPPAAAAGASSSSSWWRGGGGG